MRKYIERMKTAIIIGLVVASWDGWQAPAWQITMAVVLTIMCGMEAYSMTRD